MKHLEAVGAAGLFGKTFTTLQVGLIAGFVTVLSIVLQAWLYQSKLAEAERVKADASIALSQAEKAKAAAAAVQAEAEKMKGEAQVMIAKATRNEATAADFFSYVVTPFFNEPLNQAKPVLDELAVARYELQNKISTKTYQPLNEQQTAELTQKQFRLQTDRDVTLAKWEERRQYLGAVFGPLLSGLTGMMSSTLQPSASPIIPQSPIIGYNPSAPASPIGAPPFPKLDREAARRAAMRDEEPPPRITPEEAENMRRLAIKGEKK